MPRNLRVRRAQLDLADQLQARGFLRQRELSFKWVFCLGTEATQQTDPDGPGVVTLDIGADLGFRPPGSHGSIPVDDPVIADVAPAALLDMPAPDPGHLFGNWAHAIISPSAPTRQGIIQPNLALLAAIFATWSVLWILAFLAYGRSSSIGQVSIWLGVNTKSMGRASSERGGHDETRRPNGQRYDQDPQWGKSKAPERLSSGRNSSMIKGYV
jgi:hypothetical protein